MDAVQKIQDWYFKKQPREQLALIFLAIFFTILLLVFGLWKPAHLAAQRYKAQYRSNQEVQSYLDSHMSALQAAASQSTNADMPLSAMIQQVSQMTGLPAPQLSDQSEDHVKVQFTAVAFNAIAGWFAQIEAQGASITQAEIHKVVDGDGKVDATIVVGR